MGCMHKSRLSLNGPYARKQTISKSEFSTRFSPPDYIFRMHEGRLSLIRDLVPVLNQQKLILLEGRFNGGLNSDGISEDKMYGFIAIFVILTWILMVYLIV